MPSDARSDRASKWRRRGVIALVTALVFLALHVGFDLWFGRQLKREIARLEQRYGSLDIRSMVPPRVAPEQNRARVVAAAASLASVTEWAKLNAVVEAVPGQVNVAARADVRRAVEQNTVALQVAAQARTRPKSNWDIDYPEAARMPRLMDIRCLSNLLAAATRFDAEAGRLDDALDKAVSGLNVAQSLGSEPQTLMQVMRAGMSLQHFRSIKQILASGDPSATALNDLAALLADGRTPDPVRTLVLSELRFANAMWARAESGRSVEGYLPAGSFGSWASPGGWVFRPAIRAMRLYYLRAMGRLIERETTLPYAEQAMSPRAVPRWWQLRRRFDWLYLTNVSGLVRVGYRYLGALNTAEIAVALRRFRVETGSYPAALDLLVPRYIAQVPVDPYTGRAPEYSRQRSGFALASHGPKDMNWLDRELLQWTIAR